MNSTYRRTLLCEASCNRGHVMLVLAEDDVSLESVFSEGTDVFFSH